jgi:glutamine synthetase
MAVFAPTVNSYKRYTEAVWSPDSANWGYDNRACAVRVLPGRMEVRLPDAAVNPYLSHVVLLAAVRDGWANKTDPGPAQEGIEPNPPVTFNGAAAPPKFGTLPRTLGDALIAFEADDVVSGSLPQELRDVFVACKRDEWRRYCGAVTDWDIATYLNYVP